MGISDNKHRKEVRRRKHRAELRKRRLGSKHTRREEIIPHVEARPPKVAVAHSAGHKSDQSEGHTGGFNRQMWSGDNNG